MASQVKNGSVINFEWAMQWQSYSLIKTRAQVALLIWTFNELKSIFPLSCHLKMRMNFYIQKLSSFKELLFQRGKHVSG